MKKITQCGALLFLFLTKYYSGNQKENDGLYGVVASMGKKKNAYFFCGDTRRKETT
jgi:hypothetical protein